MKTLDKLALVTKVLQDMGCEPDKISVTDAPDDKLLISVYYKGAHKIDRGAFNFLIGDKNAELHIPEISLTEKGSRKCKDKFNIFY
jgi:hypothetical protein